MHGTPQNTRPDPQLAEFAQHVKQSLHGTELQSHFILLGEIVHKLTTILRFEADEMATIS